MAEPLGALQRQKLLDGGMAPSDVAIWQANQEQALLAGGMNAGDISLYFGQPNPDTAAIDKKIQPSLAIPGAKVAGNMWESFLAGGQMGALNLQGGAPEFVMPVEAGFMENIAHGAGLTLSDAPAWLAAFVGTTALASETTLAAPFIGAGAATAATSTLRNVRIDAWTHPNDGLIGSKDWQARAVGIAQNVGIETAISTASMGAGMVASKVATPLLAPVVGETAAKIGGFTAGAAAPIPFLANTNSLMERGELAGPQEYSEVTAQLIGSMALGPVMHYTGMLGKPQPKVSADNLSQDGQQMFDNLTAINIAKNLEPSEVAMAAANDAIVRQEILAPFDEHGNWATPELDRLSTLSGRGDPAEMPLKVEPPPAANQEWKPKTLDDVRAATSPKIEELQAKADAAGEAFQRLNVDYWAAKEAGGMTDTPALNRIRSAARTAAADLLAAKVQAVLPEGFTAAVHNERVVIDGPSGKQSGGLDPSYLDAPTTGQWFEKALRTGQFRSVLDDITSKSAAEAQGPEVSSVIYSDMKGEDVPPVHLDIFRSLEGSGDGLVNLDGRVGAFQLNAQEAEAHGFKGANLVDPAVNEKVAASIIADLSNKFNGNMEDMVVGWVGGDSAARLWISQGRDFNQLPKNIQRKLLQAEAEGALGDSHKYQNIDLENQYTERGGSVDWIPPASGGRSIPAVKIGDKVFTGAMHADALQKAVDHFGEGSPEIAALEANPDAYFGTVRGEDGFQSSPSLTANDLKRDNLSAERRAEYDRDTAARVAEIKASLGGGGGGKKPPLSGEVPPPAPGPKKIEGTVPREPTLDEHMDSVRDIVAPEVRKTFGDTLRNLWHGATHFLDTIQSEPRRQDARIGTGEKDFGFADLKRTTFSSRNRVSIFNNTGGVRLSFRGKEPVWSVDKSVPSREEALRIIKRNGGNMDDFLAYWLSAHMLELEQAGVRSGATPEQIAAARAVQADKGMVAKYEEGLQALQANKNAALEYAHSAGFWKGDVWATIRNQYSAHLYWGRAFEGETQRMGAGQASIQARQPTKEQQGSNRPLNANPLARDGDNSALMIAMADRNVAMRGIVDLLVENDIPGFSIKRDTAATAALVRDLETGAVRDLETGAVRDLETGPDGKPIPDGGLNLAKPLLAEKWVKGKYKDKDRIVIWRDGEVEVWQASSPEMLRLMELAGPEFNDPVSKVFHSVAGLAHKGIVGDLFFGLRTVTYGQWTAWVQDGPLPYVSLMEGIFSSIHPGFKGVWEAALRDGALAGWAEDADARYGQMNVEKIFKETGMLERVFNMVTYPVLHPAKTLSAVNSYLHNSSAVGAYAHNLRKGLSPTKAAQKTREQFLDPSERMAQRGLEWWANSAQFVRSTILDVQASTRSLNPLHPGKAGLNATKLFLGMTMLSVAQVAIQLLQDKDRAPQDKYFNRPRVWRDQAWMFDIGGAAFKLKAPPSPITTVFKVFPERMMEYALTQNPKAFDGLLENLGYNSMPQLVPTLSAPAVESWANKDLHFNGPIVSAGMEPLSGDMQYNGNTSETAKAIARAMGSQNPFGSWNMSPLQIDNWVREWGGTLPYQLLKATEGSFNPVKKSSDMANIPFLGGFYVRKHGAGQQLDDFYAAYGKYYQAHSDFKKAEKRNDAAELAAYGSAYARATKVDIGDGRMVSIQGAYLAINSAMAVIRAIDLLPNPDGTTPSGAEELMGAIGGPDAPLTEISEKELNFRRPAMTPDEKRLAIDTIAAQVYVASKMMTEALDKAASAK